MKVGSETRTRTIVQLLSPAALLVSLLLVCTIVILRISVGERNAEWSTLSLASYAELSDPYFTTIIFNTLWLAISSAVLTILVAFPVALFMARTPSESVRRLMLTGVMLPMIVSLLVQSFGWIAILGPDGLLNKAVEILLGEGVRLNLLFNTTGVLLGLVQTSLPLAVLPMVSSLRSIPSDLEEAAGVLGAGRLAVYRSIILPLAWPGIAAGLILTFGFNMGAFVVPILLGGQKITTLAIVIRDQMGTLLNWPMGAALSVVLVAIALGVQGFVRLARPTVRSGIRI